MHTFTLDKPDNLIDWWQESVNKFADRKLVGTKNKNGVYEWVTRKEVNTRIDNLRAGLAQLGVNEGDAVGIIANNRVEWIVAAFAAWGRIARFVPMYEAELVQIWKYIITDSQIKVLFVSKPEIYEKIKDFPKEIPTLKHIFIIECRRRELDGRTRKERGGQTCCSEKPETGRHRRTHLYIGHNRQSQRRFADVT